MLEISYLRQIVLDNIQVQQDVPSINHHSSRHLGLGYVFCDTICKIIICTIQKYFLLICLISLYLTGAKIPVRRHGRIVGGDQVDIKQYPYQIALEYNGGWQICGGSIVGERAIVTAGHCTDG